MDGGGAFDDSGKIQSGAESRPSPQSAWRHALPGGDHELGRLPIALFGASTGAAAALVAAAELPGAVAAVVSRGGRPDLAGGHLPRVRAPTLLIVGGDDFGVIELNEAAYALLGCEKRLVIVPGATHLFEEAGTMDQVVEATARWLRTHLRHQPA